MQSVETEISSRKLKAEMSPGERPSGNSEAFWRPFGCEYAESSRWSPLERFYIRQFGFVDLPARMRARLIKKALRSISWKTLLDYGSGTGAYSFYFSRSRNVRVWGVDIHQIRIDDCLELGQKLDRKTLDFVCSSTIFENNRFQPASIDVVLAIEVLQYLFDVRAGFREIYDVLKPEGYLIAHIPLLGYLRKPETILFDTISLARLIEETGFELISLDRTFGKAANFLTGIYARCGRSRILTSIIFPFLLLASIPFGGKNANGSYCLVVARKPSSK
jgi:SAM-dependent methyltransferase